MSEYIKKPLQAGTYIFSGSPADDAMIQKARDFIAEKKLSSDDVRIVKKSDSICIITKKEVNNAT